MANKPKNKSVVSWIESAQRLRSVWGCNPVTRVKGNTKSERSKTACRKSKGNKSYDD